MRRFLIVSAWLAVLIVSGILSLRAFSSSSDPPQAAADPAPSNWVMVAAWSGQGTKTTEPFTVGRQWRVNLTARPESLNRIAQLCVMAKDIRTSVHGMSQCIEGQQVSYSYTAGTYAMDIFGVNGGWTVTVEDLR